EPLEEAAFLLFARKVKKKLTNQNPVATQVTLKGANVLIAVVPDAIVDELWWKFLFREQLGMHLYHEYFFVVGAIEDADTPAFWKVLLTAPQIVVIEVFC